MARAAAARIAHAHTAMLECRSNFHGGVKVYPSEYNMLKQLPYGSAVEMFAVEIDDELVRANQKRSKVSMLGSDALILAVEHIQIYALILSLSLAWPWSYDWIRVNSIVFFFNLDFWEFTKVHTVYGSQTQAYEDPNAVPFNYLAYAITWLLVAALVPSIFTICYFTIQRLPSYGPLDVILFRAKLTRVFIMVAQLLAIPFGVTAVRLLDCQHYTDVATGEQQFRSIVLRDTLCWSAAHLGIMVPLLLIAAIYFIVLPLWMIFSIRKQLVSPLFCTCNTWRTHERNLLLKEAEYVQEIDITWAINNYSAFSSFRRPWVWFKPFSFFAKALILCIYGGLFYQQVVQTITLFVFVGVLLLMVLVLPVYRVQIFNFMFTFSIFINLCNLCLGMLLSLGVQSALLYGQNLINSLLVINLSWGLVATFWLTYIHFRSLKVVGKRLGPLWPVMPELDSTNPFRSEHTEKFFKALLSGRRVLEKCYSSTKFFAPVHELSRQVQIINAYCREAEVLEDPAHPSLWALLAEMVDAHSSIAPHSVYGTSTKDSVPHKVHQLMELVPALSRRLEQREYDFILWTPTKQRILLKLLSVATFLRRRTSIPIVLSYPNLRMSRTSTLTFLSDDWEGSNDRFLVDIEKWEAMRKKSSYDNYYNRFPSIGSLQMDDKTSEVELWEDVHNAPGGHSAWSNTSNSTVDRFLDEVDDWQASQFKHPGSNASREGGLGEDEGGWPSSILAGRKSTRSPSNKFNVRFNLDTISEQEDQSQSRPSSILSSRASSCNSTDRLIKGVDEHFPRDSQFEN